MNIAKVDGRKADGTGSIVMSKGGQSVTMRHTHPNWGFAVEAFEDGNFEALQAFDRYVPKGFVQAGNQVLVSVPDVDETPYSVAAPVYSITNEESEEIANAEKPEDIKVELPKTKLVAIDPALTEKLREMGENAQNPGPFWRFAERLYTNVEPRIRETLYPFIASEHMALTTGGCLIAYKYVNADYTSCKANLDGSHNINVLGVPVEMDRKDVNHDTTATCVPGLHVGSWNYSRSGGNKVLIVAIAPEDMIAVPTDYYGGKCRCCRYTPIGEVVDGRPLPKPVYDPDEEFPIMAWNGPRKEIGIARSMKRQDESVKEEKTHLDDIPYDDTDKDAGGWCEADDYPNKPSEETVARVLAHFEDIAPRIVQQSAFGDDNREKIEVEIEVLKYRTDIADRYAQVTAPDPDYDGEETYIVEEGDEELEMAANRAWLWLMGNLPKADMEEFETKWDELVDAPEPRYSALIVEAYKEIKAERTVVIDKSDPNWVNPVTGRNARGHFPKGNKPVNANQPRDDKGNFIKKF